jgi:hypothetical protein
MDSVEFSKVLKIKQGIPYSECIHMITSTGVIKPSYVGVWGDVLSNMLLKRAITAGKSVALPTAVGADGLSSEYTIYTNSDTERKAAFVLDGTPHYDNDYLSSFIEADYGRFITVIPDPVDSFLQAWAERDMPRQLQALGEPSDLTSALKSTRPEVQALLESIRNVFAKRFAPKDTKDSIGSFQIIKILRQQSFLQTIPSEYQDEALVYLRRRLCWTLEDISFIQSDWNSQQKPLTITAKERKLVEELNSLDVAVYSFYRKEFANVLSTEMGVKEEVRELQEQRAKDKAGCTRAAKMSQKELIRQLLDMKVDSHKQLSEQGRCYLLYLHTTSFREFFGARMGHKIRMSRP